MCLPVWTSFINIRYNSFINYIYLFHYKHICQFYTCTTDNNNNNNINNILESDANQYSAWLILLFVLL